MSSIHASQALFHTVGKDGADWLFVIRSDDGWTITRNGHEVGVGERASIAAGVEKFLALTRAIAGSDAACSAAVGAQLDKIERGGPAASAGLRVAKSRGRTRAGLPCDSTRILTR